MKSSTLIGIGANNTPVIEIEAVISNDIRDKLTRQFIDQAIETRFAYVHIPYTGSNVTTISLYPLTRIENNNYPSGFPIENIQINQSIRKLISDRDADVVIQDDHLKEIVYQSALSIYTVFDMLIGSGLMTMAYDENKIVFELKTVAGIKWVNDTMAYNILSLIEILKDSPDAGKLIEKIINDFKSFIIINSISYKFDNLLPKYQAINLAKNILEHNGYKVIHDR